MQRSRIFTETFDGTPNANEAEDAEPTAGTPAPEPVAVPERPLHELTAEEWRQRQTEHWSRVLPPIKRQPTTIEDLLGGQQ